MHKTDLISDIFATLRIAGELYFRAQLSGPFAVSIPPSQRHIRFHIVLNGACWLCLEGEEPVPLEKGDILLVPHGATQSIKAAPDLAPADLGGLIGSGALRDGVLKIGSEREKASLLCGFLHFDEEIEHPVLALLPSHLHLRPEDMATVPWMRSTLDLISLEANRGEQGMAAIVSRLIEVIFIQTIRQLAQTATDETKGFLRALSDKAIARSLSAIHAEPEKKWLVEDLAALAGQSRSAFARNFAEEVGQTPMDYLRSWRLNKARMLLTTTHLSMGEVASRCGYDCVPSFSRSFKRAFHIGPGSFRRMGPEDRSEMSAIG
nr:AraC family transcriptional regulator [uncultured Cohaesibacter sp.]